MESPHEFLNVPEATEDVDESRHITEAESHLHESLSSLFDSLGEGDVTADDEVSASEVCSRIDELQALLQMHVLRGHGVAPHARAVVSCIGDGGPQAPSEDLMRAVEDAVVASSGGRQALVCMYSQKELLFLEAALQPVNGCETSSTSSKRQRESRRGLASRPGARNSSISKEPQSVAARQRRGRIREKLLELQGLVPGGGSMDIAALLDEAAMYVAFLQAEVQALGDGSSRLFRHVRNGNGP
ncbi:hypothetical protein L7F22_005699 [Adiantum nelumboides]|nr:hypothetical protein [Adiantum nelumboides]